MDTDRELGVKGIHRRGDVIETLRDNLRHGSEEGHYENAKRTYETLGRKVDRIQTADLGVEVARGSDERLDRIDHLVGGLSHSPDDAKEGNEGDGEESVEELHGGKLWVFVEGGEAVELCGMWSVECGMRVGTRMV